MVKRSVSRPDKLRYFRGAADFWRRAASIQALRSIPEKIPADYESRIDFTFYVVAVIRLREVAWQLHKRLQLAGMKEAVGEFDSRCPRLRKLRNADEHMSGMPSGEYPFGIWYFGEFAADLRPGGRVEYVVDARRAEDDVERLHQSIIGAIDAELELAEGA